MWATLRNYFYWPRMKKMLKEMADSCTTCLAFEPEKEKAKPAGLGVNLENLAPMDWIVMDCFEAGKKHYLALGDRASGMVWGRQLKSMNTQTIIDVLSEFCETYSGPM